MIVRILNDYEWEDGSPHIKEISGSSLCILISVRLCNFKDGGSQTSKIFGQESTYRKATSSNMSHFEAHAGFFRLLKKGIFDPYVL